MYSEVTCKACQKFMEFRAPGYKHYPDIRENYPELADAYDDVLRVMGSRA